MRGACTPIGRQPRTGHSRAWSVTAHPTAGTVPCHVAAQKNFFHHFGSTSPTASVLTLISLKAP